MMSLLPPTMLPTRPGARHGLALGLLLLLVLPGCRRNEHLQDDYGSRRTYEQSVNGTDALGKMFRSAGHRVRSWRLLSPSLEKADVLVWFPDDLEPPTPEVQMWLDNWLSSTPYGSTPRVLVYVGRDYTAAPLYWDSVAGRAAPESIGEYRQRRSDARMDASELRLHTYRRTEAGDWYVVEPGTKVTTVKELRGPWAEGIDANQTNIEVSDRLKPEEPYDILLADEQNHPLVSEAFYETYTYTSQPDGRLIIVENSSWLVNGALVNHEHRKLAGKLVAHVAPPATGGNSSRLDIVFLESSEGGPPIRDTDPSGAPPTGLALFKIWPIGAVLMQAALLGILFAFMKWPIFGVPRRLGSHSLTDFGHHIAALGQMLHQTGDRRRAIEMIRLYWKSLDRKSTSSAAARSATSVPSLPSPSESSAS